MAKQRNERPNLSLLDERTSEILVGVADAFTSDPMRSAGADALARELGAGVESTAAALHVLEAFGILESIVVAGETKPTYRFRVAATFLEVLERVAAVYANALGAEADPDGASSLRAMRARIAMLEAKNERLVKKADELSFLCDAGSVLGSTLDRAGVAQATLDSVPAASRGLAKRWFLLARDGNELTYYGGAGVGPPEADEFIQAHRGPLERSLRTGEIVSAPCAHVAIPVPAERHEPAFGSIVILEAADEGLGATEIRRLTQLAELAGRSFANARLFGESVAAGVTDELTGVFNRRYFDRRLGDELRRARRLGEKASLILLDLDFFKNVNDAHGHPEGDRTLRWVAQAIVATVRDIDVVTRWGGEEFAVIVPGADGSQAVMVAERIREGIESARLRTAAGAELRITVSCGVAWAAPHIHTAAQCVAAADRCLLEAKRLGRNRTVAA